MDAPINIKVETKDQNSDYLNYGKNCQGHFSKDSEVSHSSSNNLERESLNIHIKQEHPTDSIKEELAIVNEINYEIPQDESVLNDFLWPSYLKKEPVDTEEESEVGTEDGCGEKSQFNEIQKSKYPLVLLKDLKYTHEEVLMQYLMKEYRKRLRQKRSMQNCSFDGEESLHPCKKLRSRLSQKTHSEDLTDDIGQETVANSNNNWKDSISWNKGNNFCEKNRSENRCHNYGHNSEFIKNPIKNVGECLSIANNNKVNYHMLSLPEIINLVYDKEKSLNLGTSDKTIIEVLKCLKCTFETKNLKLFNLHSQIHQEVKKCTECNFESKDTETFNDHLINHLKCENKKSQKVGDLGITKFICTDCSYEANSKRLFDAHCSKHKNNKLFKCEECDFQTNYKWCLVRHNSKCCSKENCVTGNQPKNAKFSSLSLSEIMLLICNNWKSLDKNNSVPSSVEPLKCSECNFETESQKYLEFHSQIHFKVQKCPECTHESTDTETFKKHLITHLDHSKCVSKSVPYSLRKSSKPSDKTVSYELSDEEDDEIPENHSSLEASDFEEDTLENGKSRKTKKFKCHDCSYTTSRNDNFLAHCSNHTNKKLFHCENCDFRTNFRRSLKRHNLKCLKNLKNGVGKCSIIADNEIRNYPSLSLSEIINLICSKDKSLELNTSNQISVEVLECLDCTFKTGNTKFLSLHSQIHLEVKKCTECNFESKDTETFKAHLISHFKHNSNSEMYKCNDCSYETSLKTSFDAHCVNHKSIILLKCDNCDYETKYERVLIRHNLRCNSKENELNSNENCVIGNQSENAKYCTLSLSEIMLLIYNNFKSLNENNSVLSSTEVLKCSECNFEAESQKYLEFHSQIHSKVQKCPECSHESADTDIFKKHLITHLDHSTSVSKSVPYSFRKSSKPSDKTVSHELSDEEDDKIPENHKNQDSDFEDEMSDSRSSLEASDFEDEMSDSHLSLEASDFEEDTLDNGKSRKRKKFECHDCDYTTYKNEVFISHCLNHAKEKLFQCEHCSFKTNYRKTMKYHHSKCLKNPENSLSKCLSIFNNLIRNYYSLSLCEIVRLICSKDNSLDYNTSEQVKVEVWKCLDCAFKTGNLKFLNLHSQIHKEVMKCTECNFESKDTKIFTIHLIDHFRHKSRLNTRIFKCRNCPYETKYKQSFNAHCAKHKNIKLFKCDDCDFESNYKKDLIRHKLYSCRKKGELNSSQNWAIVNQSKNTQFGFLSLSEIFLLIYNKMESLDGNASLPSSAEPLKCLECNFETTNPKCLEFHSQIHAEVLKCPECSYESTDTGTFKGHLMTHLDQSPSESESVPYSFRITSKQSNKTALDELSNNDERHDFDDDIEEDDISNNDEPRRRKIYQCHACGYTTYENKDLISHCSDHAKEQQLFECEHCDFKTNFKCAIKSHNKRHNPELIKNPENDLSKCFSIANDDNYHMLSLSEIINLFYNKDKSLDLSTSDEITMEVFKCVECTFETENLKLFNLHSQIHQEVKKCTECNFESKDTEAFKDHLINHFKHKNIEAQKVGDLKSNLKNTKFICIDCSYETKSKELFDAHCSKHKNIKLFKCDDCDFGSNYKKDLIHHKFNNCRKKGELKSSQNCVTVNQSKNSIFCSLSLSEIMLLIYNNWKSLNENTSVPSSTEVLKCSECNFETESQKYLEFHSQIHSKVQKCPECSHKSTNTEAFKKHLITHLDHSSSVSKSVSYSFKKSSRPSNKTVSDEPSHEGNEMLDSHSSPKASDFENEISDIVKGDTLVNDKPRKRKKFECRDCSYITSKNEDFLAHCSNHRNKKLFHCEHCNFKTNYRRTMKQHNFKCLKNLKSGVSKCSSITGNEIRIYPSLSLSEKINLICSKDKSLELNTSNQITVEVLECLNCTFKTGNTKFLSLHSQIHLEIKKCTECSFESKDTETFKSHLINHFIHNPHLNIKMFKCSDCSFETKYKRSFDVHCAKHKSIKLFKCDYCDFETNYERVFIRHNLKCNSKEAELNSNESCVVVNDSENAKFCTLSLSEIMLLIYNNWKSLDENTSVPSSAEPLKCSECNFETESQKYLEFHSQIHSKVQKCPECSHESTDTEIFKGHLITHLDHSTSTNYKKLFDAQYAKQNITKLFKCDDCDYETKYRWYFKCHNLKCRPNQTELNSSEVCDTGVQSNNRKFCSLSLSEIMLLIYNNWKSTDENTSVPSSTKVLKCSECNFETESQKYLEFHSQIHSKVQKCPECTHESTDTQIFKEHLQTHLDQFSSESKSVPYSFTKSSKPSSKTVRDLKSNLKNTKFICTDCSYETKYKESFDAHCAKHKNIKLFKCDDCDFESNYKKDLIRHKLYSCRKKGELNSSQNWAIVNQSKNSQFGFLSLSEIFLLIYNKMESLDGNASLPSSAEPLKCLECNFETTNPKCLEFHSQIHAEVLKCPECSYESTDTGTFKGHLMTHLDQSPSESESVPYSFRITSKQSNKTALDELSNNDERHDFDDDIEEDDISNNDEPRRRKIYQCHACGYTTYENKDLISHCSDHAKEQQLFECEHCDFKTNFKCAIKSHNKRHNPELIKNPENDLSKCFSIANDDNYHMLSLSEIINLFYNKDKSLDLSTSDEITMEVFKCVECTFETENLKLFNLHSQIHQEVKKCTECNFESKDTEAFKDHLINHFKHKNIEAQKVGDLKSNLKNTKFICIDCSYETKSKELFDAHCSKHKNIKLFKCDDCDFGSNYKKDLIHHKFNNCRKKGELKSSQNCVTVNQSKNSIFCSLSLSEIMLLIYNNWKSLNENTSVPSSTEVLKCSECNFETESQKYLEFHSQIHSKVQKCPECSHESTDTEIFKGHLITHLDYSTSTNYKKLFDAQYAKQKITKLFKCDYCDYETKYRWYFKCHNLKCRPNQTELNSSEVCDTGVQSNNRKFCSLSLSEIMLLIYNNWKSTDENTSVPSSTKVLKCSECNFETESQKYLEFHSQIHSKVQKCPECTHESTDTEIFKEHLLTHLDHFSSESESVSFSSQKRSRHLSKTAEDSSAWEEHSDISDSHKPQDSNLESKVPHSVANSANVLVKKEYKCDECEFEGEYFSSLVSHLLQHFKERNEYGHITSQLDNLKVYSFSDIISRICNDENEVEQDLNLNSDKKLYECLECDFWSKNEKHFTLHSQIHARIKKCTECEFKVCINAKFGDHLMCHLKKKLYTCSECSYETNRIYYLKIHLLYHTDKRIFHCSDCDYKTNEKFKLKTHVQNHLEFKTYKCSECDFSTNYSSSLEAHILNHSGKKKFLCHACTYGSNDKNTMKLHLLEHSSEKLYKCSKCDFGTNYKINFQEHEARLHGGKYLHACNLCDFKCFKLSSLKHHSTVHSDIKLYKCPECSFECKYGLKLHIQNMHSKTKMYKCSECKYEGNHRSNFLTHIRTHSNERKYSCSECSFSCKRKDNLKVHMTTHLKEKLFKCADCPYESRDKYRLTRHVLKH